MAASKGLAIAGEYDAELEDGAEDMGEDRVGAARRVLEAMDGDDADALDSALSVWADLYLSADEE